jgi:regulator of protease activity HflC (stomatin/prohibitin superfamily)
LDAVVLRKPTFAPEYVASIEQQQIAQQSIQTEAYKASAAVNTALATVAVAKGAADAAIEAARGKAEAIRQLAAADAYAIELQGLALVKYPDMLQWHFLDQLSTANWMLLPNNGPMPLLQLPSTAK